ncbi:MAG: magnesium transporter [Phycisphaerae bacterium]
MLGNALQPEIQSLIDAKDFTTLKSIVGDMEIHDLAELLSEMEGESLAVTFRLLSQNRAAEVLGLLEYEQQELLLTNLSSRSVAEIFNEMAPDDRTDILEEMPGELAQRFMATLHGDELTVARSLMAYQEDSIGRLMTPEYVAVREHWTIQRVFEHIRKVGPDKETLNVVYVVDDRWKLLDELRLEELVLAAPESKVSDLMDNQVTPVLAREDQETAIELFKKYDVIVMPVVNNQNTLVGIITVDDVLDVAEEEDTEDFQKMVGMDALESSYFATSWLGMIRKRLPWLVMLLLAQMLTTLALTSFNGVYLFAVLVIFMPLINSPAGNAGTQMAGLMIRGLAVQEIAMTDWKRILLREMARGLALGCILAVIGFGAAFVFAPWAGGADTQVPKHQLPQIALAVAISIAVAVTIANLLGSMLPFVFKRFGMDPAVTSGPFIASLMDVSGILVYFTIALALLKAAGM